MTPFLQLSLALAVVIVAAKMGGYISYRLGQPSVLGELLAGILLGPSVINFLHSPYFTDEHLPEVIHLMAEVGVLLLMFLAGLELHLSDLTKSSKVAGLAGTAGVVFPLGLGTLMGLAFSLPLETSIFLGLTLAATSVSISAQTLLELKVLRSRVGIGLLGAAVFDDVLVVLGLSIFLALVGGDSSSGLMAILVIILRMAAFIGIASIIGYYLLPRLVRRVHHLPISQGLIAFSFVIILAFGWMSEAIGLMAAITGAFLAGLWLSRSPVKEQIEHGISVIAYGVFVPVFFVNVGLLANARELIGESFLLFLVMTVVAVLGKVLGSGLGARLAGFSKRESLQMGVGMMSRGEVGLIVASVGISEGLIDQNTFAAVIGVVIITTLMTPPWLRYLFRPKAAKTFAPASEEGEKS